MKNIATDILSIVCVSFLLPFIVVSISYAEDMFSYDKNRSDTICIIGLCLNVIYWLIVLYFVFFKM